MSMLALLAMRALQQRPVATQPGGAVTPPLAADAEPTGAAGPAAPQRVPPADDPCP